MALEVGASHSTTQLPGSVTQAQAEDKELYGRLLQLRDEIVAGRHPYFKLSESALAQLKGSAIRQSTKDDTTSSPQLSGAVNGVAFTTNQAQPQQPSSFPAFTGLPGLQASTYLPNGTSPSDGAKSSHSATLDPIFLEKSDSLVKAEGQLKRQRLERELQAQLDQRKHAYRDKDQAADAPSAIDVDLVYLSALEKVRPISGLKPADKQGSAASSPFDENDYYSSQVQSEISSQVDSSKGSDKAIGAFTADFERLDSDQATRSFPNQRSANAKTQPLPGSTAQQPALIDSQDDEYEPGEVVEIGDEDDDYIPPDAAAFDSSRDYAPHVGAALVTPPEEDNSDYEPGEITDSNIVTPAQYVQQTAQKSPNVPVVRNQLTHLVAPQPNRVSPVVTKDQWSLELINGRPEMVPKAAPRPNYPYSRATTASPSGNGVGGSGKKRRSKKRKRDVEPVGRSKRRRDRPNGFEEQYNQEPYIKDEPISPPPFANVPEVPQQAVQYVHHRPAELDLSQSRPIQQQHYIPEPRRSGLRYEHTPQPTPTVIQVASPTYRSLQRNTLDLRRVASLHHLHRPPSRETYSPAAPQRTVSMTYGEPANQHSLRAEPNGGTLYVNSPVQNTVQYSRAERSRSPPRVREYRDRYAERVDSPSSMPPPQSTAVPRPVVVDQYGNRYYMAEPAPPSVSTHPVQGSVAPMERRAQPEVIYADAPGHSSAAYTHYNPADSRMAPPPPPSRRQIAPEPQAEYTDPNGYSARDYNLRPAGPIQYAPAPTSPIYQEIRGYEAMPPPPAPAPAASIREPTSPVYVSRSYSVRPEAPPQAATNYNRHASVAPAQYVRHDAPPPAQMRAVSVVPGLEYSGPAQPRPYVQAPQSVRYVDQNGNEVFPREVRQVSEYRYQ